MNKDTLLTIKGRLHNANSQTMRIENYIYDIVVAVEDDFDTLKSIWATVKYAGKEIVKVDCTLCLSTDFDEISDEYDGLDGDADYTIRNILESEFATEIRCLLTDEPFRKFRMCTLDTAWVDPNYRKQGLLKTMLTKIMSAINLVYNLDGVILCLTSGYTIYNKKQLLDLGNLWQHLNFTEVVPLHYDKKQGICDNAVYMKIYDFSWGATSWDNTWADYMEMID